VIDALGCFVALAVAPHPTPAPMAEVELAALLLPPWEAGPGWQSVDGIQYDATDPLRASVNYLNTARFDPPRSVLIELSARKGQTDVSQISRTLVDSGPTLEPISGLGSGLAVVSRTKAEDGQAASTYAYSIAYPDQIVVTVTESGQDSGGVTPTVDDQAFEFAKAQEQFVSRTLLECGVSRSCR
jgi:hypothetical protein